MALPHSLCHPGIPSLLCLSTETLHLQAANPWSGLDLLRTALYLSDQDGETPALEVRKLVKQGELHQSSYWWPSIKWHRSQGSFMIVGRLGEGRRL